MMSGVHLNHYANSMFRYERLSDAWIASCTDYLRSFVNDAIEGAVVLDYAFGRGNWALAFLRAGAAKVYAVDAAADNVRRFDTYCRENAIRGVEIIHGDVLEGPLGVTADILWLYGILHHITDPDTFLAGLKQSSRPSSLFFVYAYNQGSLREFVVESGRRAVSYATEESFVPDSMLLTRAARGRARDDLTAPHVAWYSAEQLKGVLVRHDLRVTSVVSSFARFLNPQALEEEFRPHHWMCRLGAGADIQVADATEPRRTDILMLYDVADLAWGYLATPDALKSGALGLFNAHFGALGADGAAGPVLVEDFLFLAYLLLVLGVKAESLGDAPAALFRLALAALAGEQRSLAAGSLDGSAIAQYLSRNRVRL
ncbi:MAG: class I SAM-dependent methyltransferase [Actinobacteria bacterium]|nr:class I SAM-dependent methyltransferase [Actinomycetota bacterium]